MIVDELIAILGYDLRGEGNLNKFNRGIKGAERNLAALAAAAARWGAIAGAAVAGGVVLLGKSIISTNAQFEKFHATLEILEGSSAKADASFAWIKTFAKSTPFEVAEVTDAFVRLRSYGIDPTNGTLQSVGDAASAMGKTLGEGVEALADAATNEFERLKQFGVTASVAGDQVTFSWQENGKTITKSVKKNGQEISKFLVGNFNRFKGAMDKQSRTWNGLVSNLSDTWTEFLSLIGQAGFFDFAKGQLEDLLNWTKRIKDDGSLARWAKNVSDAFTAAFKVIGFLADRVMRDGAAIMRFFDSLDPTTIKAIGAAFALLLVWLFPLTATMAAFVLALDDLAAWFNGDHSRFGDLVTWLKEMTGASEGLATALAAVLAALAGIAALKVFSLLKGVGRLFGGIGEGAAGELAGGVGGRSGGLLAWLGKLSPFIAAALLSGSKPKDRQNADPFAEDWQVDELTKFKGYDRSGPSSRGGRRRAASGSVSEAQGGVFRGNADTPESLNQGGAGFGPMLANMNANLAKMTQGAAAGATITDARQDNRQFPVTVTAPVTVNVQSPDAAPAATGAAVGAAVGKAAATQASRIEQGPAF